MYFPYQKGRYEVAPGLLPITQDFGNGPWDQRLMQVGDDFSQFRQQFIANRTREAPSKYVILSKRAEPYAIGKISGFIFGELARDYPDYFSLISAESGFAVDAKLTHERLAVNPKDNQVKVLSGDIAYIDAWDAVGAQVPEDLAIWKLNEDGSEELEAIHLNAPNHWAAEEKIGHSFAVVHRPVVNIEKITPWAVNLLRGILHKGPFVRFAWGVSTDDRLNHHPSAPVGVAGSEWMGRRFDPLHPKLFARVERQALWGFPELNRVLFTIRTYFQDVEDLAATQPLALKGLTEAIASMSPDELKYKGLAADQAAVISYLEKLRAASA